MKKKLLAIYAFLMALASIMIFAPSAHAQSFGITISDWRYNDVILKAGPNDLVRLDGEDVYINDKKIYYQNDLEGGFEITINNVSITISDWRYNDVILKAGPNDLVRLDGEDVYLNNEKVSYQNDLEGGFEITIAPAERRLAISGKENFVTNVDHKRPIAFFQSTLSAYDTYDGDLTDKIYIINDNYTPNISVLGTHQVTFGVKDSSGNEATLVTYIRVVDQTPPLLKGNTDVARVGYKETFNITQWLNGVTVTDNYDSGLKATIKSDTYSSSKTKLGNYEVIAYAKDSSGNEGTIRKPIQVVDNIAPVFSGPKAITKPTTSVLTTNDILKDITAHDEIDGNVTSKITTLSDGFSGNGSKVGTYEIKFSVMDNAGNEAIHIVAVSVIDDMPPIFYIKDGFSIIVDPTITLTKEQIIDVLKTTGQLTVSATTRVSFLVNEYESNETIPGVYAVSLMSKSANGNETQHSLAITVMKDTVSDDDVVIKPKDFFKDNKTYLIIGAVVVVALILLLTSSKGKNKKKRGRK